MEIIKVDKTSENHGKHNATVNLKYDDITLLINVFYEILHKVGGNSESIKSNNFKSFYTELALLYSTVDGFDNYRRDWLKEVLEEFGESDK